MISKISKIILQPEQKAGVLGSRIGRSGRLKRRIGKVVVPFDPDAEDGDEDGSVQDGTIHERPDTRVRKPEADGNQAAKPQRLVRPTTRTTPQAEQPKLRAEPKRIFRFFKKTKMAPGIVDLRTATPDDPPDQHETSDFPWYYRKVDQISMPGGLIRSTVAMLKDSQEKMRDGVDARRGRTKRIETVGDAKDALKKSFPDTDFSGFTIFDEAVDQGGKITPAERGAVYALLNAADKSPDLAKSLLRFDNQGKALSELGAPADAAGVCTRVFGRGKWGNIVSLYPEGELYAFIDDTLNRTAEALRKRKSPIHYGFSDRAITGDILQLIDELASGDLDPDLDAEVFEERMGEIAEYIMQNTVAHELGHALHNNSMIYNEAGYNFDETGKEFVDRSLSQTEKDLVKQRCLDVLYPFRNDPVLDSTIARAQAAMQLGLPLTASRQQIEKKIRDNKIAAFRFDPLATDDEIVETMMYDGLGMRFTEESDHIWDDFLTDDESIMLRGLLGEISRYARNIQASEVTGKIRKDDQGRDSLTLPMHEGVAELMGVLMLLHADEHNAVSLGQALLAGNNLLPQEVSVLNKFLSWLGYTEKIS